ncbi:SEC-C domain-containing protein [Hymenobacter sp.]|uniref:YecA family protein n=1 Tax=Hymenobacter sp. TaxID=1898978 RepID=UPI002ED84246
MTDINTELEKCVTALKQLMAASATSEVTGMIYLSRMRFLGSEDRKRPNALRLHSPARQQAFLLGLLLATEEPAEPEEFGSAEWEECISLLNDAFGIYEQLFLPDKPGEQGEEWWHTRRVAGPVFLHYFNTSLIATGEQIRARIKDYCVPFDAELVAATGISASDSLRMMTFVAETIQDNIRVMEQLQPKLEGEQKRFFKSGDFLRRDDPDYPEFMREHYPILDGYFSRFPRQGQIARAELQAAFPEQADAFWAHYAIGRGQGLPLEYPTEDSVFDFKPLVVLDEQYASCPSANNLFEAILRACEVALDNSPARRSVFKHRDKVLEQEGLIQFKRLVGPDAQIFSSVYETPKAHNEHDLLIVLNDTVLIVEAKASPPIEPSRLPERAYERLRQSFRKDTGIQKGFEQAARIRRRLDAGETVALYDKAGALVTTLNPQIHTECFCICLTRDDFGHLATNLSLLLEKEPAEPYPWAVNIWDLEAMADAWSFLNWDFDKLKQYLRQREQVHGRVLGSDELEFVGAFIHHDRLDIGREQGADFVQLNPGYSDFFDDLHDHLKLGAPAPNHKVIKPVMMNLRESLKAGQPVFVDEQGQVDIRKKMRRNDPCFCGSGIKYKKCHGM